jgi:NTE family protein
VGKLILYSVFFLNSLLLFSQQKTPNKDTKVGLVLSGGGAKGLAHIGALKVIEDSGVKIDYIAGTSMGAIVGALYASGYSADELTKIFKEVNFEELIRDNFDRKDRSFFDRKDTDRHAVVLPFNKFKLSFPSSISKGQKTYNFYVKLLDHVKDIEDFSKLPIPFLCIGTDLETGNQVILDKGYLPDAISASSAIPTLFEPIKLNDKLLIDGGVSNNYPIDEFCLKILILLLV